MARKSPRPRRRFNHQRKGYSLIAVVLLVFVVMAVVASGYVLSLDHTVRTQFEGKRWALPARVYARPLELFAGRQLSPDHLAAELADLGYERAASVDVRTYLRRGNEFRFSTHAFKFWDGAEPVVNVRAEFKGATLTQISNADSGKPLDLVRLQPLLIGSIYPAHNEDRVLVQLAEVPPLLTQALIAIEDRRFNEHHGLDPIGIARALLANLRAGSAVQGASTLTQQLVKNFYLSAERTLTRKLNEAIMAVLLEVHYSKAEIMEAYLNEIFLGQEGARAIHGFGLASQFYFGRPLAELKAPQVALLISLARGASYYDPRRHPARATAKRNQVLNTLAQQGVISAEQAQAGKLASLGVISRAPTGASPYPAFLDMVRRQLQRDYREEDLNSEGLQIFTTLDPRVQASVEQALGTRITQLEKQHKITSGELQGAAVVTGSENGEILAIAGGRDARFSGFNRALDAQRQIGSLVKPAVYLTALAQPGQFTLATLLDDGPLKVESRGSPAWTPQNYDHKNHGDVPLQVALAQSYNLSTARLGMELGIPTVLATLRALGITREFPAYPSTLLGAIDLSPVEVTQMYQTFASGGFRVPLRAIREVLTAQGERLQRFELSIDQAVDPAPVFLLNTALREVVTSGTARSLSQQLPPGLKVAGKTGTTDDLRDSWFAGFSGEHVAVVWLGRDDNQTTKLSGASGALKVWGDVMGALDTQSLNLPLPSDVEWINVDAQTYRRLGRGCDNPLELPFIKGSAPLTALECEPERAPDSAPDVIHDTFDWLREILQ